MIKRKFIAAIITAALILSVPLAAFAQSPFHGSPIKIGADAVSYVEAEDFDIDGYNCPAHDELSQYDHLWPYRSDGYPQEAAGEKNGRENFNLCHFNPVEGAYAEWTVEVVKSGTYNVVLSASCNAASPGTVIIAWDGAEIGRNSVHTGGWGTFMEFDYGDLRLEAGTHVIRSWCEVDGVNIEAFLFTLLEADAVQEQQSSGSDSASGGKDVPTTGDNSAVILCAMIFVSSALCAVALKRRKKLG